MRIVIPTYRRTDRQATLSAIPDRWTAKLDLIVDDEDFQELKRYPNLLRGAYALRHPSSIESIAQKRAWILRHYAGQEQSILMMDDDLRFSYRDEDDWDNTKLEHADRDKVGEFLDDMDSTLTRYAHAGWSMRQGNNYLKDWLNYNGRMCYVLGYQPQILVDNCELGRIETREDMDYTLQLLKKGFPNMVDGRIAVDQVRGFGAEGGCSEERTIERSNADALRLAEFHPGVVSVKEKKYLASIPRLEVRCEWKRAFVPKEES